MKSDAVILREQKLMEFFDKAPMKKTFGMDFSYNDNNSAIFVMPYNPGFDHALNQIHGGVIATLLDNAGWFTAAAQYDTWISTAEMQVRLLEPADKVKLISEGQIIKKGKKLAIVEMKVYTEDDVLIAVGSGTFAVTNLLYK